MKATKMQTLQEIYNQKLTELFAAEQQYLKCFQKLSAAAATDELRSGLAPATTELEQHIERLGQCMTLQKLKAVKATDEVSQSLLKTAEDARRLTTKPSLSRDVQILHSAQAILNVKVAAYQALSIMASSLQQDNAALLLEQCWKDNQNAYSYLVQISQNIIYPKVLGS